MHVIKEAVASNFTKIPNEVIFNNELSLEARQLYVALASFKPGKNISNLYLMNSLNIKRSKLGRLKAELKKHNLTLTVESNFRHFICYLGNGMFTAQEVKEKIERKETA